MKVTFWNRLWAAVAGLIIFVFGLSALVFSIGIIPFKIDLSILNGSFELWQRIVMVLISLLLCLLGFHGMWMLFRRRNDKGFIMQRTDLGDMSISMNALETMVHKCVDLHRELTVKSTRIFRSKTGIGVEIRIILAPGVNIPLTVNALQKQIKQYITSCSGVEVQEVKVLVETTVSKTHTGKEKHDIVVDVRKPEAAEQITPVKSEPIQPVHVVSEPVTGDAPSATESEEPVGMAAETAVVEPETTETAAVSSETVPETETDEPALFASEPENEEEHE